jgi:hypothetical protein
MTYSKSQFIGSKRLSLENVMEKGRTLQAVQQAAVKAEILTGDENWDIFLSYLQATTINAAEARDRYMNEIASPLLVDGNEMRLKQIAIIRLNERIATLQAVMNIPKELKEGGEQASKVLEKLGDLQEKDVAA